MPNWCTCELEIEGDRIDLDNLFQAAKSEKGEHEDESCFSLNKLVPTPEEANDDIVAWRTHNWGTKWDINPTLDDQGEVIYLKFDCAWSPPIEAIEKISKQFPAISFTLTFEEPNLDFFGMCQFQNGLQKEVNTPYSERFYFDLEFDFFKATIEESNVAIPVLMSRMDDPYDFDGKDVKTQCILTMPVNMESADINDEFEQSVILSSEDNIMEELSIKREEIIDAILENFEKIKITAEHNKLNNSLPVNKNNPNHHIKI
jgi:hypothetical protein